MSIGPHVRVRERPTGLPGTAAAAPRLGRGAATLFGVLGFFANSAALSAQSSEEVFDAIERRLTWSAFDDRFRARLSGTIDVEGYRFSRPAPALLDTTGDSLVNPRLSLFLDAQAGSRAYFFLQSRVDRGFDPSDAGGEIRLDEYALRLGPWGRGRVHVQVGKFATVVGNWTTRHGSWVNPFVTAPLVYENLTGIWDVEALRGVETMLRWSHVRPGLAPHLAAVEKQLRLPVVWGPSYATGIAMAGDVRKFRYAVEVKNGALGSRPSAWGRFAEHWEHPTASGRVGYQPNEMWQFGLSASGGTYLVPRAEPTMLAGFNRGDYRQLVLAHDVSFAWRHFQLWGEIYATRFEVPRVGDAETVSYYVEAKYKVTPQLFVAARWNEQFFGTVPDGVRRVRWGRDAWRMDFGLGYRLSTHAQVKLQYNFQQGDVDRGEDGHLLAAQLTVRF